MFFYFLLRILTEQLQWTVSIISGLGAVTATKEKVTAEMSHWPWVYWGM